jgi:hypothetical protein
LHHGNRLLLQLHVVLDHVLAVQWTELVHAQQPFSHLVD